VQPGRAISNRYCRGVFFGNVARPNFYSGHIAKSSFVNLSFYYC